MTEFYSTTERNDRISTEEFTEYLASRKLTVIETKNEEGMPSRYWRVKETLSPEQLKELANNENTKRIGIVIEGVEV